MCSKVVDWKDHSVIIINYSCPKFMEESRLDWEKGSTNDGDADTCLSKREHNWGIITK